jgi:ferritin
MISEKMSQALNEQVNREMYSAYLYMAMSAHCNQEGLKGFANWFMVRQGAEVKLAAIKAPPTSFDSPLDMFTQTLEHEQFITRSINDLMELAIAEKDHASQIFLEWYVTEQVEEEENDNDIIAQLKWIKDNPQGLMMLDRELAGRMTTVPTDFSKGVESAATAAGA